MNLVESILTKNPCYTCGRTITVKGLVLHSVGCPQPKASVFVNNWNSASYNRACVHAFIDGITGDVYQTLPWNRRGWHVGSGSKGSYNNSHIGVEMCEPDCIKYTGGSSFTCSDKTRAVEIAKRTYNSAVELFAFLCKKYNLDPLADGVIVSHKEASARGYGSNHGDPEHLWKGLGLPYTMNTFRKAVAELVNKSSDNSSNPSSTTSKSQIYRVRKSWSDSKSQIGAYSVLDNAKKVCKDGYYVFDASGNIVYPITSSSSSNTSNSSELYRVRKSWGSASSQIGAYKNLENAKKACKMGYSVYDSKGNVVYTAKKNTKLSITEVAKKVIAGEYGNGDARKKKLEANGYNYSEVQAEVNRLLK